MNKYLYMRYIGLTADTIIRKKRLLIRENPMLRKKSKHGIIL